MSVTFSGLEQTDTESFLQMMQDFYAIDNYPFDREKAKFLTDEFVQNAQNGGIWIIRENQEIAGYLIITTIFSFEYGGWIGFLDELYISASFRGKGLGKLAVDFAIDQAKNKNLKLLYLEIEPHNESAKKLYLSRGFDSHKRQLMAYHIK